MHSRMKGKPNNWKTYCPATMILLTTMGSCEASSQAQYVQPPDVFRPVHLRISTHPFQALHNQPHFSRTAVGLLLRNLLDCGVTHVPDNRHQEQDESNPASSCLAGQRESLSVAETCDGMNTIIMQLPYNNPFLLDGSHIAYMEKTVTQTHNI